MTQGSTKQIRVAPWTLLGAALLTDSVSFLALPFVPGVGGLMAILFLLGLGPCGGWFGQGHSSVTMVSSDPSVEVLNSVLVAARAQHSARLQV